ncbi:hypothetical protein [Agrococcus jenensis]|uniref:hypothetical protein n=1 Tax=Agrococcus jenensis TaxID=46353 RepID=UPI000F4D2291|nr:hypothetical protein [Agrococcus jenensis]
MPTPMLTARAHPGRRWASRLGRALSWLGVVIFAGLAFVSAGWTALFVVVAVLSIVVHRRTTLRRWELDQPGADASFRFGPRASRSVRLADVAGIVIVDAPGTSARGIPVTRDHERWWLVDDGGRALGQANTEGLDPADVQRFRSALGVPFVPLVLARRAGAVPLGMPWHQAHPAGAIAVAVPTAVVVMLVVVLVPPYWA